MSVEQELARRVLEQSAVARLGEAALDCTDPHALMRAATEMVAETLGVPFVGITELNAAGDALIARAVAGWPQDVVGTAYTLEEAAHSAYTLSADAPVVIDDLELEPRFASPALAAKHGVRSGAAVAIRGKSTPFGALAVHALVPNAFGPDRLAFLKSVANIIGSLLARCTADEQLRHQALHDSLTGLPNRALLIDRLEHALARRDHAPLAVLFIDLDDFKIINDTLGHGVGDEVLRDIAGRLPAALRPQDTVARFGGDEFVILCEDLENHDDAMAVAGRVREAFIAPFTVGGFPRQITASIGVVVSSGDTDPVALIRDADAAVYRAKERGRGWIETHDDAARLLLVRRISLEREIKAAIDAGHFVPHFQPIIDLATGGWRHMEALARWEHPERGCVLPADFIEVAETTGLLAPLGEQILAQACAAAVGWPGGNVGVNVSHGQLSVGDFARNVTDVLVVTGLPPERLTLELTETALFDATPAGVRSLDELTAMGVHLVLDDFGTGYSSLSHLRRFRVTAVKVDRSFVANVHEPGNDQIIVRAIISMAAEMGITVVAEGVETAEQADALRMLGCPTAQGYHFARPAPLAELMATMSSLVLPTP